MLWEDVHKTYQNKFLYTSRLNQGCIEDLFSVIRGKGGHVDNPSPKQFRLYLRQVMVDSILLKSKSSNCEEDGDKFLVTLNNLTAQAAAERQYTTHCDNESSNDPQIDATVKALALVGLQELTEDEQELSEAEENILTYIAGYVARKTQGSSKVCNACKQKLFGDFQGSRKETLLSAKRYDDLQGPGLVTASTQLVTAIEAMEIKYKMVAEKMLTGRLVRAHLVSALEKEAALLFCNGVEKCQLRLCVVSSFATIRLHFTLRDNSRHFTSVRGNAKRKCRKLLKLQHL